MKLFAPSGGYPLPVFQTLRLSWFYLSFRFYLEAHLLLLQEVVSLLSLLLGAPICLRSDVENQQVIVSPICLLIRMELPGLPLSSQRLSNRPKIFNGG